MCLIVHKNTEIKTAKEDITVYKIVYCSNNKYLSAYYSFQYIKDKIYSINDSLVLSEEEGFPFDSKEGKIVYSSLISKEDLRWIYKGFHFAFTKARLYSCCCRGMRKIIVKCTIPKGTKYIIGIDKDLGVSDAIILH